MACMGADFVTILLIPGPPVYPEFGEDMRGSRPPPPGERVHSKPGPQQAWVQGGQGPGHGATPGTSQVLQVPVSTGHWPTPGNDQVLQVSGHGANQRTGQVLQVPIHVCTWLTAWTHNSVNQFAPHTHSMLRSHSLYKSARLCNYLL